MSANWKELEISPTELEELVNFDLLSTWAIDLSRVFLLRWKTYRKSLLVTESCSLFLTFLLLFPINIIIFRHFNWLSNNSNGLILVLVITALLSILMLSVFNYYLWNKAKQLKVFAVLLEKVKQYNNLIDQLQLVAELNFLSSQVIQKQKEVNNPQLETELKTALTLTKNSLINSIELEKIINRISEVYPEGNRHASHNRYQLLANLENSLANLGSFSHHDFNDYQQLLSEAIEIGLSVHQEIRKHQTLRQS